MILVEPITPSSPTSRPGTAARTRETFALPDGQPAETAQTAGVSAAALGTLLDLQETAPDAARKGRAQHRARSMLTGLAALQRAVAGGGDATAALRDLAAMASEAEPTGDPVLDDLVQSVTLRVRIELARRGL